MTILTGKEFNDNNRYHAKKIVMESYIVICLHETVVKQILFRKFDTKRDKIWDITIMDDAKVTVCDETGIVTIDKYEQSNETYLWTMDLWRQMAFPHKMGKLLINDRENFDLYSKWADNLFATIAALD